MLRRLFGLFWHGLVRPERFKLKKLKMAGHYSHETPGFQFRLASGVRLFRLRMICDEAGFDKRLALAVQPNLIAGHIK